MPLDIPSPPEHPFSFCLHEKDFTLLNHTLSRLEPSIMEAPFSGVTERLTKMDYMT